MTTPKATDIESPRFIVITPNDPRIPEDERYDPHEWRNVLFDSENERVVASDGGEPEDQTLGRDWSWVPDELNVLAVRIDDLTEQLRRVIAGCEVAVLEPDRTRDILRDMHDTSVRVYNGEAPAAPTGEPHGD